MQLKSLLLILLITSIFAEFVHSQIPRTLSYQGILSDTTGLPKPDGNYGLTFRLYNVSQNGAPLWTETQILGTTRGLFSAVLGDISPFPDTLRFDRRYWLGIQVSPDPELTPRIQLTATGYSIRSRTSDTAEYARTVPGSSIVDSARIAGTVPNNSLASGKIASGQVVKSVNNLHDAVTLRAQGGATITSNGDTITINSGAGGGGTGIQGIQNTDNTLAITNPTGPTATINTRIPFTLNGQDALRIFGFQPYLTLTDANAGNARTRIANANGDFAFFTESDFGSGLPALSIKSTGGSRLTVLGQDALNMVGYQPYLTLTDANSGYLQSKIQGANGDFAFYPSSGLAMVIKTGSGNVGIGTLTPSARLEVLSGTGVGASGFSSANDGVVGISSVASHSGVWGHNDVAGGVGVTGSSTGGTGLTGTSTSGTGVYGGSTDGIAISGKSMNGTALDGSSIAGNGVLGSTSSAGASGVYGENSATHTRGVLGLQEIGQFGSTGVGVMGEASPTSSLTSHDYGVHGIAHTANQYAGYFDGIVYITTDLFVGGSKNFKIDNPNDPMNKYLIHSCVESNSRMNIYNGNITTDASGDATIEMPNWFEAFNIDFRYQLTIIGDEFAQARVSKRINGNRFSIRTDKPNIEVSWQVTGVRNDAFAKAHPFQVEVDKPEYEKGTYTHPELYGLPPKTFDFKPASQGDQSKKEKQ